MKKICIMVMLLLILCTTCIASQSPSKMKIGDTDGQWTYIGIYKSPESVSGDYAEAARVRFSCPG